MSDWLDKFKYSDKANVAVGSTAAIVSAASIAVASSAPVAAPVIAVVGAGIATGALAYKLKHEKDAALKATKHKLSGQPMGKTDPTE